MSGSNSQQVLLMFRLSCQHYVCSIAFSCFVSYPHPVLDSGGYFQNYVNTFFWSTLAIVKQNEGKGFAVKPHQLQLTSPCRLAPSLPAFRLLVSLAAWCNKAWRFTEKPPEISGHRSAKTGNTVCETHNVCKLEPHLPNSRGGPTSPPCPAKHRWTFPPFTDNKRENRKKTKHAVFFDERFAWHFKTWWHVVIQKTVL